MSDVDVRQEIEPLHHNGVLFISLFIARFFACRCRDEDETGMSRLHLPPQEWSSSPERQPPRIKEEEEGFWASRVEEGPEGVHITEVRLQPVPVKREDHGGSGGQQLHIKEEEDGVKVPSHSDSVKSEDEEEKPQTWQLQWSRPEENGEPRAGEDRGTLSQSDGDGGTSESSESQTDDSKDWKETGRPSGRDRDPEGRRTGRAEKKPFGCSECGKRFGFKVSLKRHLRIHTGEKPFSCSVCDTTFSRHYILAQHMKTHTGEKPFSCSVCSERFSQKGNMRTHMRTHTGEKPFSCSVCGERFSEKGNMRRHMRTHTGEKPFSCPLCGERFSQKGTMMSHKRTHTGEKPFCCAVCGKSFTQKFKLKSHKCVGERSGRRSVGKTDETSPKRRIQV